MSSTSVADILNRNARQFADKDALIWATGSDKSYSRLSYAEFERTVSEQAMILANEGINAGDKVVFLVTPGPAMYSLIFALYRIGAVPVLVDPGMGLKRMLHCYQSVGATAFIGVPAAALVRKLAAKTFNTIRITITVKDDGLYRDGSKLSPPQTAPSEACFHASEDDLLHIAFTTGSTGPAKAVECTHGMAIAMTKMIVERYGYRPEDIELITIPFIGILTLLMGNTGVMPKMDAGKPAKANPELIIDAIERFQATCMSASPALLNVLGNYGRNHPQSLTSLRFVSAGGAPTSLSTLRAFHQLLPETARFEVSWGATEALPLAAMDARAILASERYQPSDGKGSCLGSVMEGVQARIMKTFDGPVSSFEEAPLLAPGEIGEIVVAGPNVSRRYHADDGSNALHKVEHEGQIWHRTGDLGYQDEEGLLWFTGRKSELVITPATPHPLHSVQCEGIVNSLPGVYRSALVRAEPSIKGNVEPRPAMCVELEPETSAASTSEKLQEIKGRILALMKSHEPTRDIDTVLFHPAFPVDIRHNAKINRKALGEFATRELETSPDALGYAEPSNRLTPNAWMIVPILGWLYIFYGILFPLEHWTLQAIWVIDVFLSVVVHLAQIPAATRRAAPFAFSRKSIWLYTFIFGATWWKAL